MSRTVCIWVMLMGLVLHRAGAAEQNLQLPPAVPATNAPVGRNLLVQNDGVRIESVRQWRKCREEIRSEWEKFLGGLPKDKAPLKAETLEKVTLAEFTRERVRYQVEEGIWTDGYLLQPKGAKGKLPAVVVFHPTTPLQAKGVAGLAAEYPEDKWQGVQLVKRGYVVWCPRNYIYTEGADWAGNAARVRKQHPTWSGMTRMVWDAIRAADYVESLPGVDRQRIGCLGHSLGGKEVLYAMAFDERYKAGVSSEGGLGLKFSNWDAAWYFGPAIREAGFPLENDQVLALIAPRAFLLLAGGSADGDRSWAFIEEVMPVYKLLGAPGSIGWFNHGKGHAYPPEARAVAEEFLDRWLRPDSSQ